MPKAAAIDTLPPTPGAALITGAAHRIGRALALGLAEDGWVVALHYHRSAAAAAALAEEIRARGGQAVTVGANLALEDEVLGLIPPLVDRIGPLGLLLNNASVFERDQAMTATRASWDLHLETNLRAPFVLSQAFAAQLPHGHSGVIINMIDQRVWNLTPDFTSYTISKVGLWGLTQTLALALAPRIRVNGIGPGPTLASQHQTAAQFARQCQSVPLQRAAGLDEMLAAVKFILATPSLTGQMIALDGGQHLCWAPPSNPLEE